MAASFSQTIKRLAKNDRIAFKKHSVLRMHERGILVDEVKEVLIMGDIIEIYQEDKPLPSVLILGKSSKLKVIHAVVAIDEKDSMLWIITIYIPDPLEWDESLSRRKIL